MIQILEGLNLSLLVLKMQKGVRSQFMEDLGKVDKASSLESSNRIDSPIATRFFSPLKLMPDF